MMSFVRKAAIRLKTKKRKPLPRKWSDEDDYFYQQMIHLAREIGDIPSSLAYEVAKIVRDTSALDSDWKKVARALGLDNEGELREIEDAARGKELQLYVALTSRYMINPEASLGGLLEALMKLNRHDILLKIKDSVQEIIHEYSRQKSTNNSFGCQNELKKEPVEEDSTRTISALQETIKSTSTSDHLVNCRTLYKHHEEKSNDDSAFYEEQSTQNSLLKILSMNDQIIKDKEIIGWPCRKEKLNSKPTLKSQNKENVLEDGTGSFFAKLGRSETKFPFVDPFSKIQALSKSTSEKESLSVNPSIRCTELRENGPVATYATGNAWMSAELWNSCNDENEHYDGESSCDEDLDPSLMGQDFPEEIFSANLNANYAASTIDSDTRNVQEDGHQYLNTLGYEVQESIEQDDEDYDINNSVNARIENLVAEKDASVRSVEKAEREAQSAFLPLETCKSVKKPEDYLLSSLNSAMPPGTSVAADSIKVMVIHSEEDSDIAVSIASALVKEFQMAAVAECQLDPVWHLDPSLYRKRALYWADVVMPLITNKWLEDITNEKPLHERETASLNARAGFRILENMFMNRGSVNLSCIPVVMEGTSLHFRNFPEIQHAIKLPRDIYKNGSIQKLGVLVKGFHILTKDSKKEAKRMGLE